MIDPLIQSALNQKTEAKLWGNPEERSQGDPAMGRREEARFRCLVGLRLGQSRGRASPYRAKSVFSASFRRIPAAAHAVSGVQSGLVQRAITQGAWFGHLTGEVPQCLPPPAGVSAGYKQDAKGPRYALLAGTVSYRPRLQGYQQSQSKSASLVERDERRNRKQSVQAPVTRIVSQALKATKWPTGTSFRKLALLLRNILTGTVAAVGGPSTTS